MLQDMIRSEMIALNVAANGWEQAVQKGGELLLKGGCISKKYIRAMIQNIQEAGPYMVITKHLAMPHAKSEDGVLRDGISILTLAPPVEFGNLENDPVKYVFCLAAKSSSQHLAQMQNFVRLLEQPAFFTLLDEGACPKEITAYIHSQL